MKRVALLAVAAALGCSSNNGNLPITDFLGPSGLAIAPLVDRDLLFIANQGSNDLRAMTLCHTPNPASCQGNQDFQFLPGPIRVLPGSILAGERPVRLAGLPLTDSTGNHGAILVAALSAVDSAGNEIPAVQVLDAANLFAAVQDRTAVPAGPQIIPLPDPPVDVAAPSGPPGSTVTAFAVSHPVDGSPTGTLSVITVTVSSPDAVAQPTLTGQCALDFLPTRIAAIPDRSDFVYIADGTLGGTPGGTGDGMVEISTASIPAAPAPGGPIAACPERRIPASDPLDSPRRARPLDAIAVSPASLDQGGAKLPSGQFLLGVTLSDSALCADHAVGICPDFDQPIPAGSVCVSQTNLNCGEGRIVIFNNSPGATSSLVRAPAAPGATTDLPMEPLRPPGAAREVAFMGRTTCPAPVTMNPGDPRCTAVRVGVPQGTPVLQQRSLIGTVSTIDGAAFFIDIDHVRFFDDIRDSTTGTAPLPGIVTATLVPQPAPGVDPTLFSLAAVNGANNHQLLSAWMNSGVTRSSEWRAAWHATVPGLESLGGTLTQDTPHGPITLKLPPGKDLTPFINSPEIQLGLPSACTLPYPQCVGDFVRVLAYSSTPCSDFLVAPITTDIPILAVNANSIVLQPVPGFDPDPSCFGGNVGGTFEVHGGNSTAGGWIILEDLDVLGRIPHGGAMAIVSGNRFDYPLPFEDATGAPILDASGNPLPQPTATDNVLAFSLTGPEPTVAGTILTVFISSGASPTTARDTTIVGTSGYAGPMLVYSSPQRQNDEIVFTAITGSNSLMFLIPAQFGFTSGFAIFY